MRYLPGFLNTNQNSGEKASEFVRRLLVGGVKVSAADKTVLSRLLGPLSYTGVTARTNEIIFAVVAH